MTQRSQAAVATGATSARQPALQVLRWQRNLARLIVFVPMLGVAGAGYLAFTSDKRKRAAVAEAAQAAAAPDASMAAQTEEPITNALKIDDLKIELGYALLPLVNAPDGTDRLTEQIKALRRSLAIEMGFVMPSVRILDNMQLPANSYVIRIKEVEAGRGDLRPGMLMVMDPRGQQITLQGEATIEPTFGLPAKSTVTPSRSTIPSL